MMYFLIGICLLFVLFPVLYGAASLAVVALWRIIEKFALNWSAQTRARIIFILRIFPFVGTQVFIFAFLLPSYFLFEPVASGETAGIKLMLAALLSAIFITTAFHRIFKTWRQTRQLIKDWLGRSQPVLNHNSKLPVYRLVHPFPVISLVGFFRPRIFIASQIFDLLDDREIAAAMAHEFGHLKNRDNLKRWLLRGCRDLLVFPIGDKLDRIWAQTAETAADEHVAALGGNQAALDLASALVKIARIVPPEIKQIMPSGAFLIEAQSIDITFRVRYLIQLTERKNNFKSRIFNLNYFLGLGFGIVSILVLGLAMSGNFLLGVHNILENVVELLQ